MSAWMYLFGLAVVAALAWFVSAPLLGRAGARSPVTVGDPERYRLEREKDLAFGAIKEAEFDFQMGKLSPEDYARLRAKYEGRALAALAALERHA